MQLVRVPGVTEHFENFVLLDTLSGSWISLFQAYTGLVMQVLFFYYLEVDLRNPNQSPNKFRIAQYSACVKIIVYSVPTISGAVFQACIQLVTEIGNLCSKEVS